MAGKRRRSAGESTATHKKRAKIERTHKTKETDIAATQPQSVAQFFSTTELLERVLINVGAGLNDLLALRRVSHKWQDVVEGSPSLKKILFLAPEQADHEWHTEDRRMADGEVLEVLAKKPTGSARDPSARIFDSARVNPLLFTERVTRDMREYLTYPSVSLSLWRALRGTLSPDWISQELYLRKTERPSGIKAKSPILNMFATQPPVPVMILGTEDCAFGMSEMKVQNPNGVKIIDILRASGALAGEKAVVVDSLIFPPDELDQQRRPVEDFLSRVSYFM